MYTIGTLAIKITSVRDRDGVELGRRGGYSLSCMAAVVQDHRPLHPSKNRDGARRVRGGGGGGILFPAWGEG